MNAQKHDGTHSVNVSKCVWLIDRKALEAKEGVSFEALPES